MANAPFLQLTGKLYFQFLMEELRDATGLESLADSELRLNVTVYDWYAMEYKDSTAYSWIYPSGYMVDFLGGRVRTFKAGSPLVLYVSSVVYW